MKIKATLAAVVLGLVGCKSTPEVIEPRPLDTNASYAFNVANQTVLTRNNSPLRDFSMEEIQESKTKLEQPSGGEASLVFGSINILTGNLTGLIDIAGGSMAALANSKHKAAFSGWYVSIPMSEASDGFEARDIAREEIQSAVISLLESKGNKVNEIYINGEKALALDDGKYFFGLQEYDFFKNKRPMQLSSGSYMNGKDTAINGVGSYNFNAFVDGKVKGYQGIEGYNQYLLDLTKALPDNYFFYETSFPKALKMTVESSNEWNCTKCIDKETRILSKAIVPAIYTQGKKYEFIKPE